MYVVQDRLTDGAYQSIPGKFQFGELVHAKSAIEKHFGEPLYFFIDIFKEENNEWHVYDKHENFIGRILKLKSRPKRKSNMTRKKKRSAKQLANDRRLGRMAKARHAKKRGKKKVTRKKTVRRKANPKRKVSAKSHLWVVFRCREKSVYFLTTDSYGKLTWTGHKGKSVLWKERQKARSIAGKWAGKRHWDSWQIGAADASTTSAQISAECTRGK